MSRLVRYKFSDLYEMASGISSKPEQAGHGAPFLSFSTVFNNYFLPTALTERMDTSELEQKKYSINEGDIFLTRTSEVIDELGMSSVALKKYPSATYSGFLKRLRPIKEGVTYPKFMAFYLRSPLFRKTMTNNAVLTLRASLNEEIFSYLDLLLPHFDEQVKAGDLLFLLSQKIECNNRINAELATMTKILYDYWFVQFDFPDSKGKPYKSSGGVMVYNDILKREVPKDWKMEKISKFASIGSGYPFDSASFSDEGAYKVITIKNVQDGYLDVNKTDFVNSIPSGMKDFCLLEIGDILISLTGNVGRICLVDQSNLLLNQRVGKLICEQDLKMYFYNYFNSPDTKLWLENISTGTSQKNLSPIEAVDKYFLMPPNDVLESFNALIANNFNAIINNSIQNRHLISLRDWLLPLLMNGQVTTS